VTARLVASGVVVRRGGSSLIDGISMRVAAGELVAVVGPNGSGKTTLLSALLGATRIDAGEITLDGTPLRSIAPRARARILTMVAWGAPADFAMRARDLVALGRIPHAGLLGARRRDDDEAVDEALVRTSTAALAERPLETLSAGELARVQLARAFAQRAEILLLDEPTANLDLLHQIETMRALRAFAARGGAAVVAMHDLTLAARACDRVVVLARGRVRADGPPRRAIDERVVASVFGVHARIARDAHGFIEHVLAVDARTTTSGEPS
jgi:iron complex transport system ATP-binding protein